MEIENANCDQLLPKSVSTQNIDLVKVYQHGLTAEDYQKWKLYNDDEATENVEKFKEWMMEHSNHWLFDWLFHRETVKRAFEIILDDIPISAGANGEVEDLICGPAILCCLTCNVVCWISFIIIGIVVYTESDYDPYGMALFPKGSALIKVLGVFLISTLISIFFELRAAAYVLPVQAIAAGDSLVKKDKGGFKGPKFWKWLLAMVTISLFYNVDLMTSAIFIARVVNSCTCANELHDFWAESVQESSVLKNIPFFSDLTFKQIVQCGVFVMILQFLYALAYSVPISPNLSDGIENNREKTKCGCAPSTWCFPDFNPVNFKMADLKDDEHLGGKFETDPDHPMPENAKLVTDEWLVPPSKFGELVESRRMRAQAYLEEVEKENGPDSYKGRVARHRRARIATFHTVLKNNMGYGRAVQALVESGRLNVLQWQDDLYLKQAEHGWHPWRMVSEMRRTNIRFALFALQAFFIPNFQITFYGIAKLHNPDEKGVDSQDISDYFTAGSTVVCTLLGMKYLYYEMQSVRFHQKFAWIAIQKYSERAQRCSNQAERWEGIRMQRRARMSKFFNALFVVVFGLLYIYLILKVIMVMLADKCYGWNIPSTFNFAEPWTSLKASCMDVSKFGFTHKGHCPVAHMEASCPVCPMQAES